MASIGCNLVKPLIPRRNISAYKEEQAEMVRIKGAWIRNFAYGLLAGIVATIALFVGTGFLGLPFPPEAIFQLLIAPVPGSIQSVAVETLREYAKYSAFTAAAAFYSILYGFIAVVLGYLFQRRPAGFFGSLLIGMAIPTLIGLGLEAVLAPQVSLLSTALGWLTAGALLVAVNLGYAWLAVPGIGLRGSNLMRQGTTAEIGLVLKPSRRGFLKKAIVAAVALAAVGIAAKLGPSLFSGQPLVKSNTSVPVNPYPTGGDLSSLPDIFRDPRIADLIGSEVSDNRVFYRVDINAIPPQLNLDQWSLNVHGKVNNPLVLNRNSLTSAPSTDEYATLECVSNTVNPPGALISNAKWTGIPLATLLNQAGLSPDAKYVVFHCADGYTVGIPLDRAMQAGALLAYKMNDEMLPNEHGFPLRAIVPGIYGMMNAKWITEIEAVDSVYLGYWQERGWTNDARIKTASIIYYPQANTQVNGSSPIAGVAFAGDRGISKVEVSTDGGNTWNDATLKPPKSAYSWILWAFDWKPTAKGSHTILARATDGKGQLQDPTATQPFPEGATGYNSIDVTVA